MAGIISVGGVGSPVKARAGASAEARYSGHTLRTPHLSHCSEAQGRVPTGSGLRHQRYFDLYAKSGRTVGLTQRAAARCHDERDMERPSCALSATCTICYEAGRTS